MKRKMEDCGLSLNSISFLHDLIFDFMEKDLETFVSFGYIQKSWSLQRFAHLLKPVIESKQLESLSRLKNVRYLDIVVTNKDDISPFLYTFTSLRQLFIEGAYKLDLTCFKYLTYLFMDDCHTTIPLYY